MCFCKGTEVRFGSLAGIAAHRGKSALPPKQTSIAARNADSDCVPHQAVCRSSPVSGSRLPKTGIFQLLARDYRRFRSEIVQIRSIETQGKSIKERNWRALIGFKGQQSLAGLGRIRTSIFPFQKTPLKCRRNFRCFGRKLDLETFAAASWGSE